MMMAAKALLDRNPARRGGRALALSGTCALHRLQNIVKSVLWAAEKLRSQSRLSQT